MDIQEFIFKQNQKDTKEYKQDQIIVKLDKSLLKCRQCGKLFDYTKKLQLNVGVYLTPEKRRMCYECNPAFQDYCNVHFKKTDSGYNTCSKFDDRTTTQLTCCQCVEEWAHMKKLEMQRKEFDESYTGK